MLLAVSSQRQTTKLHSLGAYGKMQPIPKNERRQPTATLNGYGIKWVKIIIYWRNRNYDEYARRGKRKRNEMRQRRHRAAVQRNMCTNMRQNGDDKKELLRSFHPILSSFSHSVFDSHSIDDARCKMVHCIRIDCAAARAHTHTICN